MNKLYEAIYVETGDMDERLWLNHDPQVKTPSRPHALSAAIMVHAPLSTPIRSAVKSVQDLRIVLEQSRDVPSAHLVSFFQACERNPQTAVLASVERMRELFVGGYTAAMASLPSAAEIAKERFKLAATLYFRVMEEMLACEKERLKQVKFDAMLHSQIYHTSLMACALEVCWEMWCRGGC